MTPQQLLVIMSLVVAAVLLVGLFVFLNFSKDNYFELADLVLTNKTADLHKVGTLVALIMSSWAFAYLVLTDKLNEMFMTIYMGVWAASGLLAKFQNARNLNDTKNSGE